MTLYEINEAIASFDFQVDEETGEILNIGDLDKLQMDRETKIENIGLYYKDLTAEAAAIKEEIRTLQARAKTAETKAESLKRYLSLQLQGEKFKTSRLAISYRRSTAVRIEDDTVLLDYLRSRDMDQYLTFKDPVINKTALKSALIEGGIEIPGASLEEKQNIQIK